MPLNSSFTSIPHPHPVEEGFQNSQDRLLMFFLTFIEVRDPCLICVGGLTHKQKGVSPVSYDGGQNS